MRKKMGDSRVKKKMEVIGADGVAYARKYVMLADPMQPQVP
jgi:hypothetical protein